MRIIRATKRYKNIYCKCGDKIRVMNPLISKSDKSGKGHGHCFKCMLEWHWNPLKGVYCHKIMYK